MGEKVGFLCLCLESEGTVVKGRGGAGLTNRMSGLQEHSQISLLGKSTRENEGSAD